MHPVIQACPFERQAFVRLKSSCAFALHALIFIEQMRSAMQFPCLFNGCLSWLGGARGGAEGGRVLKQSLQPRALASGSAGGSGRGLLNTISCVALYKSGVDVDGPGAVRPGPSRRRLALQHVAEGQDGGDDAVQLHGHLLPFIQALQLA